MKKLGFLFLFFGAVSGFGVESKLPSIDLFSKASVSATQALTLGDIVGALFVGFFTYLTIVLPFLIGIIGMSSYILKSGRGDGGGVADSQTIIRFAMMPMLWLIGGALGFAIMHIFLTTFYSIDIYSWIKMFLEVRYETSIDNLNVGGTTLSAAKYGLLVLDVFSKIVFWSIPAIFSFIFFFMLGYILSIFLDNSGDDSVFKKTFSGVVAAVVVFSVVMMYENSVTHVMFKNAPTISPVGTVGSAKGSLTAFMKYAVNKGFGKK